MLYSIFLNSFFHHYINLNFVTIFLAIFQPRLCLTVGGYPKCERSEHLDELTELASRITACYLTRTAVGVKRLGHTAGWISQLGGVVNAIVGWLGGVGRWDQRGGSLRGGASERMK